MASEQKEQAMPGYSEQLSRSGFRFTKQRREVYDALMEQRDHPTATDVFMRVQEKLPHISLATVYNCLETLSQAGLVRQVNFERGPTRYCPNLVNHAHFFCTSCGSVVDVELPDVKQLSLMWKLPRGHHVTHSEISLSGLCPACRAKEKNNI